MATQAVLLAHPVHGEHRIAELHRQSRETDLSFKLVDTRDDDDAIVAACAGASVLMAPAHPRTAELACRIPGLKLVQTMSAGTEGLAAVGGGSGLTTIASSDPRQARRTASNAGD